jgi:lysozyme
MTDVLSALANDLKIDEGFREHVYKDHLGFDTIGYGFLIDARKGGGIPRAVAEFWLSREIEQKWLELTTRIPWVLEQPEPIQRALGNMAYQLGVGGLVGFVNMLASIRAGDYQTAAIHGADSTWAEQTPQRAQRVLAMIRNA